MALLTWAEAAEKAMGDSSRTWHTAIEVFELVMEKQIKEINHGRSRAIESLRTALINHNRRGSKFAWDQVEHKFALYSRIPGAKKKAKKVPSKASQNNKHANMAVVTQSVKSSSKRSVSERKERASPAHTPQDRPPPSPLTSPSQESRLIPFEGVPHHDQHSCHGNTVYYDPLPHATIKVGGESPSEVEVTSPSPGTGRRGIVQSLNMFDLQSRHCVAPPPKHGMLIARKFLRCKKRAKTAQNEAFFFPPIEFKSEHFPEIAFHYFSKANHTACANDTAVFFHINRGQFKTQPKAPHIASISPEAVFDPSESESEPESSEEEDSEGPIVRHVPYSKPKVLLKLQSPAKKSLLKSPTLQPRPQPQHHHKVAPKLHAPQKPREKLQQSKAAVFKGKSPRPRKQPLAITQRDMHHLLTHPDAALAKANLRGLLTIDSFMKLPVDQRKTVAQFLPSMDQEGDPSGYVTARKSAFSNVFFAAALREWQKSLRNSEFTPEYQARVRADERKRMADATQVNVKPPRLVFPPEACHVPKCHEVPSGEAEERLLGLICGVVQYLTKEEAEEAANQSDSLGSPDLECTEKLNGTPSANTASPAKAGRLSKPQTNRLASLPQRGRPKHGIPSSIPPRGRPKNGSVSSPVRNGLIIPLKRSLQPSSTGASLAKRHQPLSQRVVRHPYLIPGSGLAEAVQRSPTLAARLPELLTPKGLRLDYLSFVPSHIPYKEVLATLQKANDSPTSASSEGVIAAQRRRSQNQPPKRYLARHVMNQSNPVYHDHFATLDLDHQPEQFEIGNGDRARAESTVQSNDIPDADGHSQSSKEIGKREDLLFSVTESIPQRPCSCGSLPMVMCQNCKYLYHSSCTSVCTVCGWSLAVSY